MDKGKYPGDILIKCSIFQLCEYIATRSYNVGCPINNLQLQKILYYLQGYFLVKYNKTLFRESIVATEYGPMVPDAYYHYTIYSALNMGVFDCYDFIENNKELLDDINLIVDKLSKLKALQLVKKTQNEESWKEAMNNKNNRHITNKSMLSCFLNSPTPFVWIIFNNMGQ